MSRSKPADEACDIHIAVDFNHTEQVQSAVEAVCKQQNSFDLILLNAGVLPPIADLIDTSWQTIDSVMQVNVWANKTIVDTLRKLNCQVQQVVAISSGASRSGSRGWNVYSVSKAALNMLFSLYAKEWTQPHICSLAPGLINTAMQDYLATVTDIETFPAMQRLHQARGTEQMPDELSAAHNIIDSLPKLLQYDSGSFIDIRNIDK